MQTFIFRLENWTIKNGSPHADIAHLTICADNKETAFEMAETFSLNAAVKIELLK